MTASPPPSVTGFSAHLRANFVLGLPLVGAQLAQMLIGVTDTVMLGWLGTTELAAGTLAFQVFFILLLFGLGFGAAIVPLLANALGRDDPRGVRRAARMGLWSLVGLAVLFMVPLWFTSEVLVALKQQANLAASFLKIGWLDWLVVNPHGPDQPGFLRQNAIQMEQQGGLT